MKCKHLTTDHRCNLTRMNGFEEITDYPSGAEPVEAGELADCLACLDPDPSWCDMYEKPQGMKEKIIEILKACMIKGRANELTVTLDGQESKTIENAPIWLALESDVELYAQEIVSAVTNVYTIDWYDISRLYEGLDSEWLYISDHEEIALVFTDLDHATGEWTFWIDNYLREESHIKPTCFGWSMRPAIPTPEEVKR